MFVKTVMATVSDTFLVSTYMTTRSEHMTSIRNVTDFMIDRFFVSLNFIRVVAYV